jgi:solute carrier family 39 (zinc transporter), member 1/2/3
LYSLGAIFFVLLASTVGIVLPLLQKRYGKWKSIEFLFVCGKHLGTGVLLSLAFIHLLFPAIELLGSPCNGGSWTEYPFAMLFCLIAVLLMHMIELVAHTFIASRLLYYILQSFLTTKKRIHS